MNTVLVLFEPKNITFGNVLTQKYWTYLPGCACAEGPLGVLQEWKIYDLISSQVARQYKLEWR